MFCGFCGNQNESEHEIIVPPGSSLFVEQLGQKAFSKTASSVDASTTDSKKSKFVDPEFPPNSESLGYEVPNRKIIWKRVGEVVPSAVMVQGSIEAADIQQGNIGDCYFLACLSSIAQVPDNIQKIFTHDMTLKAEGKYRLMVCKEGIYQEMLIDDYIPVFEGSNRPVFCKPNQNEVWVMLLEKAWAKLCGSYGNISAGYPHEVLNTFLEAPCFYHEIPSAFIKQQSEKQNIWSMLREATSRSMPICGGSRQSHTCKGIKPGHTYTILGAYEVSAGNQITRILKLRNPWGDTEYLGRYSEHDTMFWNQVSLIEKVSFFGEGKANDGVFTIELNEFIRNFESLDISHCIQGYSNYFVQVPTSSRVPTYFQLLIDQTVAEDYYITVEKDFNRNFYIRTKQVQYGHSRLLIAKQDQQIINGQTLLGYKYIDSLLETNYPDCTIRLKLRQPGVYIIMAETQFAFSDSQKITLSVYSQSRSERKTLESEQPASLRLKLRHIQEPDPLFFSKVFSDHALHLEPISSRKRFSNNSQIWSVSRFLFKNGGFGYIYTWVPPNSTEKIQIKCIKQKVMDSGFYTIEPAVPLDRETWAVEATASNPQIVVFGIDFGKECKQVVFPPNGIKVSRYL